MSNESVSIRAVDRLSFTVFLALAVHALLIFGINFTIERGTSRSPTLDVTLSLHKTDDKVEDDEADFLADASQLGSGTLDDKAILKTTEQADIEDNQIFHTTPTIQQLAFSQLSVSNDRIIASNASSDFDVAQENSDDGSVDQPVKADETILLHNITDVATLKALLDESRQSYAKRPRIRTLTAVSTKRAIDASYIHDWLGKVERVGNQNYPKAARTNRLSGSVRLAVSINSDGSLRSVTVTGSSGFSVLDQSAKQIVYLSAPFQPFSAEMIEQYDVLEIIRTWQFRIDNQFGVAADG